MSLDLDKLRRTKIATFQSIEKDLSEEVSGRTKEFEVIVKDFSDPDGAGAVKSDFYANLGLATGQLKELQNVVTAAVAGLREEHSPEASEEIEARIIALRSKGFALLVTTTAALVKSALAKCKRIVSQLSQSLDSLDVADQVTKSLGKKRKGAVQSSPTSRLLVTAGDALLANVVDVNVKKEVECFASMQAVRLEGPNIATIVNTLALHRYTASQIKWCHKEMKRSKQNFAVAVVMQVKASKDYRNVVIRNSGCGECVAWQAGGV